MLHRRVPLINKKPKQAAIAPHETATSEIIAFPKPSIRRYWKNICCTSDCANARLHAGHLRCRVDTLASMHCLQKADTDGQCANRAPRFRTDVLCKHFDRTVLRMLMRHVEHLRILFCFQSVTVLARIRDTHHAFVHFFLKRRFFLRGGPWPRLDYHCLPLNNAFQLRTFLL